MRKRGAALVEFVICVPALLLLWHGVFCIGNAYAIKQRLQVVSRYAAWADAALIPEPAKSARIRAASASQFIDQKNLLLSDSSSALKIFFLSGEKAYVSTHPAEIPGVKEGVLSERYILASDPWRFSRMGERLKNYKEKTANGSEDFKNWKEQEGADEKELEGYD